MTVSWGRRERWGVESGRVADFVGLLESAELDASGGYCGWNTTTPPGSVVHAPPSRPHPRSRIPAQRPTPIARNRERCRSCTQRSSLNTASNSKRKPQHSGRHIASHANDNGRVSRAVRALVSHLSTRNKRPDRWNDRLAPSTNRSSVSDAHAGVGSDPFHAPRPHPSRVRGRAMTPRAPTDACEVVP